MVATGTKRSKSCHWFYCRLISARRPIKALLVHNRSKQEAVYPMGIFWWTVFLSWGFFDGSWWGAVCFVCLVCSGWMSSTSLTFFRNSLRVCLCVHFGQGVGDVVWRGREGAPTLCSEGFKPHMAYSLITLPFLCHLPVSRHHHGVFGEHPSRESPSTLKISWRPHLESYLSAHVLHPGQCQLSQVPVFHSGAHQRHGDVPDGQREGTRFIKWWKTILKMRYYRCDHFVFLTVFLPSAVWAVLKYSKNNFLLLNNQNF